MSQLSKPPLKSTPIDQSLFAVNRQASGDFFDDSMLVDKDEIEDLRIRKTIELLQSNLKTNPSLEAIAKTVNLSPSRLRNLFSKVTGLPLAHYLKLLRLEAARYLLATEFLTVKEVMAKTGFKDPSHFNRDFKAAYGMTPSQYRNQSKCYGSQAFPNL